MPIKPIRGIFARAGGKRLLAKYLLPHIPPHQCYVEPFAGGAALLCAKSASVVEVLNDTDENIVNVFRCVRFHPEALCAELDMHVNARATFNEYRRQVGLTDIQRAAHWLFLNLLSFGGDSTSFGVQRMPGGGAAVSITRLRSRIGELHRRLETVIIEKKDWLDCVKTYDSPETFFFCDPPYVGAKDGQYAPWSQEQMAELAAAIQHIRGHWLLTVNNSPANRKLFAFAKQKFVSRPRGIARKTPSDRRRYKELIVYP